MSFGRLKKMKIINNACLTLPKLLATRNDETPNRKGVLERFVEGERQATRNKLTPLQWIQTKGKFRKIY